MMQGKRKNIIRKTVDVCMTVLLVCLMAYQVTGEELHEWFGIGMTVLVIVHQILNRKWYSALFQGRYHAYRIVTTVNDIVLLLALGLTAFCGMSMSSHAVPFLYGMAKLSFARRMHLSMSYWAFLIMGLHLGLHIPVMFAGSRLPDKAKTILSAVFCIPAGIGLWLFLGNKVPDYLFFRVPFAFLDYEKAGALVFLENILQLSFWAYLGAQLAVICRNSQRKSGKKNPLLPVVFLLLAILLGVILTMTTDKDTKDPMAGWGTPLSGDASCLRDATVCFGGIIIMAKYAFDYETGEYEYIEEDGFSIDRGEYTYNWDDSEYRREEEEESRSRMSLFDDEEDDW